jgi:serine kinase of HPr protein (carbohydrate metabolism regulator)
MNVKDIGEILEARIVCGEEFLYRPISCGFASDLMSDVLTLDSEEMVLLTGLANLQTIRTSEMAEVSCIVFVRNKKVTREMIEVARENNMVLMECKYSMFKAVSKLAEAGLNPVY